MHDSLETQPRGYPMVPQAPAPTSPMPLNEEDAGNTNLLAIAWRSRWIILLCVIAGGGAALGYLQRGRAAIHEHCENLCRTTVA